MNIGQIRYFVAVYQAGSFSKAAKDQFITVQAVSKSIADLENELGRPLFERKSRGVAPTPFGDLLFHKAQETLASFDQLQKIAFAPEKETPPSLRLSLCTPNFANNAQTRANIAMLLSSRIGAPVDVALSSGYDGLSMMREGKVDALITVGRLDTPFTECISALSSPTAVSVPFDHPLASRKTVTLDDLADYPVIVDPDLDFFNESILATYVKRGVRSERFTPKTKEDMLEHFMKRQGYAFSVAHEALADSKLGNIIIPIDPADAVDIPICLVTPKGANNPLCKKALAAFAGKAPL